MAQLFDDVFNPQGIYEMLFFNSKMVLIHPTLEGLEKENEAMYNRWLYQAKNKFNDKYPKNTKAQTIYERHAPYYPEFCKIVAITYGTVYSENGTPKRYLKKIVNEDEFTVLNTFMKELYVLSSEATKSSPQFFPILCGHNILNHDIPLLIKKCIQYKDKLEKGIPLILKRSLGIKPWESGVIDTVDVWKFNGYDRMPLMLISDYLGLKKTVDLLPLDEMSQKYWEMVGDDAEKALEFVSLQSATQTNLVIQLIYGLREL
jgi:hypothetical protein